MRAVASFNTGVVLAALFSLSIAVSIVSSTQADESDARERVILMKNGRVLTGVAGRNAGGWLLEQSNGRVQVPIEQVNLVANSLVDAYRQQRDSVAEPTPATHMNLAQWCISYRLHGEARDELRKCLNLDPEHTGARKLMRRLDDMLDPPVAKSTPKDQIVLKSHDGFLVPDAESLGGLSNETAAAFTQRVQPLLMNKCGNASCHGTTTPPTKPDGFHLMAVRPGSNGHRLYTERNLAEVLRYVDLEDPSLSPLVAIPQGTHAGTAGVFNGSSGNGQLKMLRAWIKTVADEKRTEEEELRSRPSIASKLRKPKGEPLANRPDPLDGEIDLPKSTTVSAGALSNPFARNTTMSTRPERVAQADESVATTIEDATSLPPRTERQAPKSAAEAAAERKSPTDPKTKPSYQDDDAPSDDPFDPNIFNRRFHSRPRR